LEKKNKGFRGKLSSSPRIRYLSLALKFIFNEF
jgi:hypothetical protein